MNKSEEYIENESFVVVNPDYPVISKENALKAVDMAREEGANNLIEQSVFNGHMKYQQGMDFMKQKAIEAYKNACRFGSSGCCQIKKDAGKCDCDELKDFINELA
ncbi:hypothetical protein AAE250_20655 [Bacteroides sp. GD17]|jgi:hypothetical protein|uniref:hypothetical protein n=1 Tax=Bacteroides sp. GD17 TaxID=3139826 RepID=UPI0025E59225|nr:hypothetical protein [uncultured Bacteroides sp.]